LRVLKRAAAAPFTRDATGVSLEVEPAEVTRGGTVRVSLTLDSGALDGSQLQIGLVCTQFTDVKRQTTTENGTATSRVIERSELLADWRDVPAGMQMQSFEFTVPASAPFSYEGATVSWAWSVAARRPRRHRIDPRHDVPIWVRP
jgi:hypothetical protein